VYLWLLTKLGIIGFILMMGFVVTALLHGARMIRRAPPDTPRSVPAGLIACVIALMISSFFGRILTLPTITPFVAYALGTLYIWWDEGDTGASAAAPAYGTARSRLAARA
jgi:O-antigen ligase